VNQVQDDIVGLLSATERKSFVALLRKIASVGNERSRAPLRVSRAAGSKGD
jgi:hypothetical protein